MTSLLGKIFRAPPPPAACSRGDAAYAMVMTRSDDLLRRMQDLSRSGDAARAVMADVWAQNHNVPFMATVFEAVQEAKSPIDQRPEDK